MKVSKVFFFYVILCEGGFSSILNSNSNLNSKVKNIIPTGLGFLVETTSRRYYTIKRQWDRIDYYYLHTW